jgi:hypothetical protein
VQGSCAVGPSALCGSRLCERGGALAGALLAGGVARTLWQLYLGKQCTAVGARRPLVCVQAWAGHASDAHRRREAEGPTAPASLWLRLDPTRQAVEHALQVRLLSIVSSSATIVLPCRTCALS